MQQTNNPEKTKIAQEKTKQSNDSSTQRDEHFIGHFEVAPHFMRDNPSIFKGYRVNFNTTNKLLKSLFMLHNQSVNIWSHCLAALFFIFILASFIIAFQDHSQIQKFKELHSEVDEQLHKYHSTLKNITQSQEDDQLQLEELHFLKNSLLGGYREMLNKLHAESETVMQVLENQLEDIKHSVKEEFQHKLRQFQKAKLQYQKQIAPHIVEEVHHQINGTLINKLSNHLSSLRQHLDSNLFQKIQMHTETPNPHHVSRWPIFVFLGSAVLCLLFSTIFHLFHPMSSKTYGLLLRFDFAGISLLIAGSAFPCFYYGMYCQMAVATIYLTFTVTMALVCFIICLFEWIHRIGNQVYRSVVFGLFGCSMFVPLSHMVINDVFFDNYGDPYRFSSSIVYYILLISSYGFGLYVFTVKCPERNNPGKYDICGHSHQIWHFMVVLGIIFTYFGLIQNFEMRKQSACPVQLYQ